MSDLLRVGLAVVTGFLVAALLVLPLKQISCLCKKQVDDLYPLSPTAKLAG